MRMTHSKKASSCFPPFISPQAVKAPNSKAHTHHRGKLRHGACGTQAIPNHADSSRSLSSHPQRSRQFPESLHAARFLDLHLVGGLPCLEDEADGGLLPEAALPASTASGPHL